MMIVGTDDDSGGGGDDDGSDYDHDYDDDDDDDDERKDRSIPKCSGLLALYCWGISNLQISRLTLAWWALAPA